MVSVYEKYITVRFKASYYNFAGTLTDPDSAYFKLYNSVETTVMSASPTKSATGKYYYDMYASVAAGAYVGEFSGELDNKPARKRFRFVIRETTT